MGWNLEGVVVDNAGLVLLQGWYPMLFDRLGLVESHGFASDAARWRAVHALQFVASGREDAPEFALPLNKVLCGLALDAEPEDTGPMSEHDRTLCKDMITAAADRWPAIRNSSVDGFRGNWLARPGVLGEMDGRWKLTVERRAYDILIGVSPFTFSIVRYPWMARPLDVTWPY
ncbi:hypothetical protein GCM10027321_20460 [Massilia terrae]|uniref:Contractile injection system tape measure protein n=1 Tax=Massilia terrae TaxID=1811224 RepID=A0ABT2CVE3_9BURK|nr:contractile injection system tape measure protein [Massilia terrae]MCS0657946.1 contractile injection system tape measure protein [Massilia terrae]